MEINLSGKDLLDKEELKIANKLIQEYFPKIERLVKNKISLKVLIKRHDKEGERKKFSIHAEVLNPGDVFKAKAFDWDLARTLHKVFVNLENEIEHRFHTSEQK